ncbi:heterokaryon incompatibility protein-domain-containing protein [Paraphoma chrysanthemicola]|uniref:Heterokaryon incompatibility protein-domain-containing protein n=1 Tax=Paraphoma chrysanthemicola TaxID=798071 RepID=A0A8K0R1S4_9PLEO|nr:heterokaryon incompatibility protein-domain-containing protein [Paraphoma chrysanthemicola]
MMDFLASICCWPIYDDVNDTPTETTPLMTPRDLPTYGYQTIAADEFRVLVLHPARSFSDDIVVHLQTRKRSDDKFYEAISYSWGTNEESEPVLVQDEEFASLHLHNQNVTTRLLRYYQTRNQANATLHVRSNVVTLLRYLRYQWFPRYLWLDALCINQSDKSEKGDQVNQMGDIYRKSGRTLIWLGSSRTFPRPLSAMERVVRSRKTKPWRESDQSKLERGNDSPEVQLEETLSQGQDFRHILKLPWFQRRWVIQEVALSPRPRVVFGHDTMSFEDMTYLIDQLGIRRDKQRDHPRVADALHTLESMTSLQRRNSFRGSSLFTQIKHDLFLRYYHQHPKSSGPADFIQILVSMHAAQCSDDRDRIFALNSLGGRPTTVDYQDSVEEVYSRFATEECTYSLETLFCCGAFPSQCLPSWVPDWRSPRQWIPIKSFEKRPPSHQLLSENPRQHNQPRHRPIIIESRIMVINAIPYTVVATRGPRLCGTWREQPWRSIEKFHRFFACITDSTSSCTRAHSLDQLMKTLTAGGVLSGTNLENWLRSDEQSHNFMEAQPAPAIACCDAHNVSFCEYPRKHLNVFNILQRIERVMEGRCAFVTQRGDWGIGPSSMLSGDYVVALPGCQYPLVLRPSLIGVQGTYKIVGDCYITPFEGYEQLSTHQSARAISIV